MSPRKPQNLFGPLGIVLLALIAVFFVSNIAFVSGCMWTSHSRGINACRVSATIESIGRTIPSIAETVSLDERRGPALEAEVVGSALAFIWASAMLAVILMFSAACTAAALLSSEAKRAMREYCEQRNRSLKPGMADQMNKLVALCLLLGIGGFVIFYGRNATGLLSPREIASSGILGLYMLSGLFAACLIVLLIPAAWTARSIVLKKLTA